MSKGRAGRSGSNQAKPRGATPSNAAGAARTATRARASSEPASGPSALVSTMLLVGAVLVLAAVLRLRMADFPLERDEGEYAYAGQLILQGHPPYQLAYNMKFPGVYYSYALIMAVFGQTIWGIRVGLLLVNFATAALVFALGRRWIGLFGGAIASIAFVVFTIEPWSMGTMAHATHFVVPFVLAGILVLDARRSLPGPVRALLAGVLFGIGILMKQHAFLFAPLGLWMIFAKGSESGAQELAGNDRSAARAAQRAALPGACFILGAGLPLAILVVVLAAQGVLASFWFWTFAYARAYISQRTLSHGLRNLSLGFSIASRANLPLWVAAGGGLIALWTGAVATAARMRITMLLALSLMAVVPGLYFREHYFLLVLPAAALLVGVLFEALASWLPRTAAGALARPIAALAFGCLAALVLFRGREMLFTLGPRDIARTRYGSNPFVEAPEIARYIREHSAPEDTILVLGSEPEIYFYANRRSATGYVYCYALVEDQPLAPRMREQFFREVEAAHPKYIVAVQIGSSWLAGPYSDTSVIDWGNAYTQRCYDAVGVAEIQSKEITKYAWGAEAISYRPTASEFLYTFRRKSDEPCFVKTAPPAPGAPQAPEPAMPPAIPPTPSR